ncbi:MAG TPA: hypothetical protein VM242_14500 [Acidimicrobiales bacterium]|jgi:hypothetical protein|nr:hypothetical protein [Acidimicrobiales bacterium]
MAPPSQPWWRRALGRAVGTGGPRLSGEPTSANGASSFHLTWVLPPVPPLVEVSAVLEVVTPPAVDRLYFWALQVAFVDRGADRGAAHVGLQWNRRHPGGRAVNWGGYAPGGGLLRGSASPLPSAPDDPNTRDLPWEPGRPYRLRVSRSPAGAGAWRGEVADVGTGAATVVRDLYAGGDALARPVVWSEVFARCEHPSVTVRWSGFEAVTGAGERVRPTGLAVNYQATAAGGCDNTLSVPDGDGGVLQVTGTDRRATPGGLIAL